MAYQWRVFSGGNRAKQNLLDPDDVQRPIGLLAGHSMNDKESTSPLLGSCPKKSPAGDRKWLCKNERCVRISTVANPKKLARHWER